MDRDALSYMYNTFNILTGMHGEEKGIELYKVIYGTVPSCCKAFVADRAVEAFADFSPESDSFSPNVRADLAYEVSRLAAAIAGFAGRLALIRDTGSDFYKLISREKSLLAGELCKFSLGIQQFGLKLADESLSLDELVANLDEVLSVNFGTLRRNDCCVTVDDEAASRNEKVCRCNDVHVPSCVGSECACEQPHPTTRGGTAEEGK